MSNYIAITEARPNDYHTDKKFNQADLDELMNQIKNVGLTPVGDKLQKPFTSYTTVKLSEDTFKSIESVATISFPIFGEKEYKINDVKFQIFTEEEYEKRYGSR